MTLWQTFLFVGTLIMGGGFTVTFVWLLLEYISSKRKLRKSLKIKLYKITVPKISLKKEQKSQDSIQLERETIAVIEQFLASVASIARENKTTLKDIDYLTFEIATLHNEIIFYVGVPEPIVDLIDKQIHSIYAEAEFEPADEYNIFVPRVGFAHAAYIKLNKGFSWPLRTYQQIESDPLNVLTNALAKVTKDEGAIIQILMRPAKDGWQKKSEKIIKDLQERKIPLGGKKMKTRLKEVVSPKGKSKDNNKPLSPIVEEAIKAIAQKNSKVGFEVNIRIVASSPQAIAAKNHVRNIAAAFEQFSFPQLNRFKLREPKQTQNQATLLEAIVFRTFNSQQKMILSSEELGSIIHLPDSRFIETPEIIWLGARSVPAPAQIPKEGRLVGYNVYRGVKRPFLLPDEARRRHFYIIGKTGTGKTTLMLNMIRDDIEEGRGVAYLDPHGDAIDEILTTIPKHRIDDVIIFRPGDVERPVGLNMLEYDTEELKDFVVGEMIAIFYKLFPPEIIGPMFEHNMRNVMLTLMEDKEKPGTIAEIPRMFTDERFQRFKISKVKDSVVRSFWENEMAKTSDFHKSEMLGYLISKVGRFVENRMMRNIIGQAKSGLNFRDIMDNKKILLVNLSKGEMGDINANLIGMILVTKIQMAALSRTNVPEKKRQDFYLYIDEFQNFTTNSIPTILSEARKYHLNMILAHQFITQVEEDIRAAVFGNVGTILSYRVGAQDAEVLEKEFEPELTANDIVNLSFAHAYIKSSTQKTPLPAFSLEIPPPWEVSNALKIKPKVAEALKQLSRLKYGRDRALVEKEIENRGKIPTL